MKPSEYISQHGAHRDYHSLENVLMAFRIGNAKLLDERIRRDLLTFRGGAEIVHEFDSEMKLAKDTLLAWEGQAQGESA